MTTRDPFYVMVEKQCEDAQTRADRAHRWRMLVLALFAIACLLAPLAAQTVRVANYSGQTFDGWKRATVDVMPPHEAGRVGDVRYVLGRRIGADLRVVDLRLRLDPGQVLELDLATAIAAPFARGPLPADPIAFFGSPSIAGKALQVVRVDPDGAGYLVHLRTRVGRMLCANVWLAWYPDVPGWCTGEAVIAASNPTVGDMAATVPPDFALRFGAADVLVPGLAQVGGACLLPQGEILGDGQARSFPLALVWRQHLRSSTDWASAGAAANLAICANGVARLWPGGNPSMLAGASPLAWTIQHWAGAVERLHRWDAGPLGVVAGSGQTGAQEDQVFVGAEAMAGRAGLGAETVRYLVALGQSRRPCHHLEASGDQIVPALHPTCVFWSSRPHWHTGVSPDQLGKPRALGDLETHGWYGPDREHWLVNTLAAGARLTGSPALQWQLSAHARNFLLAETVDPRLSTSSPDAARSVGWAGIVVAHLWKNLEDRALAEQVAERWRQRVRLIYVPQLGARAGDIWDPRADDRIKWEIGFQWEQGWMPEQQAVGVYGLDLACSLVGPPEGRALALRSAKAVLDRAFVRTGDRWVEWERLGYRGADVLQPHEIIEGNGAHRTGWYRAAWFPLATATVLRHEPTNERALSIWRQQLADGGGGGSWFPPEVGR